MGHIPNRLLCDWCGLPQGRDGRGLLHYAFREDGSRARYHEGCRREWKRRRRQRGLPAELYTALGDKIE